MVVASLGHIVPLSRARLAFTTTTGARYRSFAVRPLMWAQSLAVYLAPQKTSCRRLHPNHPRQVPAALRPLLPSNVAIRPKLLPTLLVSIKGHL